MSANSLSLNTLAGMKQLCCIEGAPCPVTQWVRIWSRFVGLRAARTACAVPLDWRQ